MNELKLAQEIIQMLKTQHEHDIKSIKNYRMMIFDLNQSVGKVLYLHFSYIINFMSKFLDKRRTLKQMWCKFKRCNRNHRRIQPDI